MAMSEPHDQPWTWLPRPFRKPGARMSRSLADTAPHEGSDSATATSCATASGSRVMSWLRMKKCSPRASATPRLMPPARDRPGSRRTSRTPGCSRRTHADVSSRRAVVDDDHLERPPGLGGERGKKALEPPHAVVGHHHGRDERAGRRLPRARRAGPRPGLGRPEPLEQARLGEAGQGGARRGRRRGRGARARRGRLRDHTRRPRGAPRRAARRGRRGRPGGSVRGGRAGQEPDPGGDPIGEAQGRGCYPRPVRAFPLHSLRARP